MRLFKVAIGVVMRGLAGFAAGFIVACFALVLLGMLPPHGDLSVPELNQEIRALWLAFYIACGVGVVSILAGKFRVSKFWMSFVIVFGVICFIPFWPGKWDGLLPLGTPYVNWGYHPGCWGYRPETSVLLTVHIAVSLLIAGIIHGVWWSITRRRNGSSNGSG